MRNSPADPRDKIRLIPYLMANFNIVTIVYHELNNHNKDILDLLEDISDFVSKAGRWIETRAVRTFQFSQMETLYGKDHPATISAMSNLAVTLGDQGQLEEVAKI